MRQSGEEGEMKAEIGGDMQLDPWIEKIGWMETKGQMFKGEKFTTPR